MLRSRFSSLPGAFNESLVPDDGKRARKGFSFSRDFEKVIFQTRFLSSLWLLCKADFCRVAVGLLIG